MTRRFLSVLMYLLIPAIAFCQQSIIEVQRSGGTFYVAHTVAPKENFYSIGRLYNVSPRELASFNQLSMENGLSIGQHIKIPLDKNNFTQSTSRNAAEALVPLYHVVASDETLFRIGMNYKNVPVGSLKKWNHLQSDQLNEGTPLIVGYLKVSKSESPLASAKFNIPASNVSSETVKKTTTAPVEKVIPDEAPLPETKPQQADTSPQETVKTDKEANEGFFKKDFLNDAAGSSVASANATAAVFKSTSGWQDGKFYCFNNNASPGSIVKISIPASGKSVYAKVLDAIPDIKQNEGVQLVLSNAAASSLGISEEKFETVISFLK